MILFCLSVFSLKHIKIIYSQPPLPLLAHWSFYEIFMGFRKISKDFTVLWDLYLEDLYNSCNIVKEGELIMGARELQKLYTL